VSNKKAFKYEPQRQIYWPDSKQWECVYFDHDANKHEIQEDPCESEYEVTVEHVYALVFPWAQFVLQVDRMQ
jgi:hypothetical protein